MSDRQALIARLRKWANNTDWPSEAYVLLAAATALEEAQGVPRVPNDAMRSRAFNYAEGFAGASTVTAQEVLDAFYAILDAALAEPKR